MNGKFYSTVTDRGQISIPATLRKLMHLKAGQKLSWKLTAPDELSITVTPTGDCLGPEATRGYARKFKPHDKRSTDEIMQELRAGERE